MIKGFINIIVSFLLLTSTAGLSITRHYCGDKLVEIGIYKEPAPCCDMDGCCHNETSFFQVKENFFTPDNSVSFQNTLQDLLFSMVFVVVEYHPVQLVPDLLPFAESPPPLPLHTALSLFQSFRC